MLCAGTTINKLTHVLSDTDRRQRYK